MKPLLFSFCLILAIVACGGPTKVQLGQSVSGTITDADPNDNDWKYQKFVVDVTEGARYTIDLSTKAGTLMGIRTAESEEYIVLVSGVDSTASVEHTFIEGGSRELLVKSPEVHLPSPFTSKISVP